MLQIIRESGEAVMLYWALEKLSTYLGQSRSRPTIYNVHLNTKGRTLHRIYPRKNKDFSPPKPEVMEEKKTETCRFLRILLNSRFMPSHQADQ